jgi:hypothetical protein
MTEADWPSCEDTRPMLKSLRDKATDRKLRLFTVACCHRIWPMITDVVGRQAVELAERLAEGEPAPANPAEFIDYVHYKGFSYIDGFRKERNLRIASHAVYAAYNALPDVLPPDAFFGETMLRPNLEKTPVEVAWAVAESWRRGGRRGMR